MFVMQALKQKEKTGIKLTREAIRDMLSTEMPLTDKMLDSILKYPNPKEKAKEVYAALLSLEKFNSPEWVKLTDFLGEGQPFLNKYEKQFGKYSKYGFPAIFPSACGIVCMPPIDQEFVKNPAKFVKMAEGSKDVDSFINSISKAYGVNFGVGWSKQ